MKKEETLKVTADEFANITTTIFENIVAHYGESKHFETTPYVFIEDSPYADEDVPSDLFGEYCHIMNSITLYWKNISSLELLARTLVHEYQHYLQSPSWRTRYYNMGYGYNDHPYEVQAFNEEERWREFI